MYFPKNRIKTGLVSNGNLLVKSTSEEYYGPYFETYTGKYYAGKSPDYTNLIELIISNDSTSKATINASKGEVDSDERFYPGNNASYTSQRNLPANPPIPLPPKYSKTEPTSRDYINGEYSKYFAKKTNEYIYLEISKEDYNKLKNQDPTILWPLYDCLYMQYSLNSQDVNKKLVINIERNNQWYGFFNYMTRYYFKETQENLFTDGGEYATKDGKEYIGDYHIHPEKGPMVGAVHVTTPHEYLYPMDSPFTGSISTPSISSTPSYSPPASSGGGGGGY